MILKNIINSFFLFLSLFYSSTLIAQELRSSKQVSILHEEMSYEFLTIQLQESLFGPILKVQRNNESLTKDYCMKKNNNLLIFSIIFFDESEIESFLDEMTSLCLGLKREKISLLRKQFHQNDKNNLDDLALVNLLFSMPKAVNYDLSEKKRQKEILQRATYLKKLDTQKDNILKFLLKSHFYFQEKNELKAIDELRNILLFDPLHMYFSNSYIFLSKTKYNKIEKEVIKIIDDISLNLKNESLKNMLMGYLSNFITEENKSSIEINTSWNTLEMKKMMASFNTGGRYINLWKRVVGSRVNKVTFHDLMKNSISLNDYRNNFVNMISSLDIFFPNRSVFNQVTKEKLNDLYKENTLFSKYVKIYFGRKKSLNSIIEESKQELNKPIFLLEKDLYEQAIQEKQMALGIFGLFKLGNINYILEELNKNTPLLEIL